jgi:hypothetical protein
MTYPHESRAATLETDALLAQLQERIPSIHTDRLRLRPPTISDFSVYAEIALAEEGRFLLKRHTREDA